MSVCCGAPLAHQYHATAYADYREMLRKEKPDVVSVVTPNTATPNSTPTPGRSFP